MPHKLLEHENIVKKTNYNLQYLIGIVFSAVKELLEFSEITGTSYTQLQAVNIAYVLIHRTGKFRQVICEFNRMPEIHKKWVRFKHFFRIAHQELRETSDLIVEDAGMQHANMVKNVVAGIQEALQQEQAQTETQAVMPAPVDHVANVVQNAQQQLATQLQQM